MMDYHIILLNGPPRSGKDTIANMFYDDNYLVGVIGQWRIQAVKEKFAYPIKWALMEFFDIDEETLEFNKDNPILPSYVTPRRALINLSEQWAKPTFGPGLFGMLCGKRVDKQLALKTGVDKTIFTVSDSGFVEEAAALQEMHPGKVHLVKLRRDGTDFRGDSRSYISFDATRSRVFWLDNNGSKVELYMKFKEIVEQVCKV